MNKKGFTLIEVLAVITILAAVSLIVIPTITGSIRKTNKTNAKNNAINYISAVETYAQSYALKSHDVDESLESKAEGTERKIKTTDINDLLGYNGESPSDSSSYIIMYPETDCNLNTAKCYKVYYAELKFGKYTVHYTNGLDPTIN